MWAQRECSGIAICSVNLGAIREWVGYGTLRPLYPWERVLLHIVEEAEWAQWPVRADMEKRNSFAPTEVRNLGSPSQ